MRFAYAAYNLPLSNQAFLGRADCQCVMGDRPRRHRLDHTLEGKRNCQASEFALRDLLIQLNSA